MICCKSYSACQLKPIIPIASRSVLYVMSHSGFTNCKIHSRLLQLGHTVDTTQTANC